MWLELPADHLHWLIGEDGDDEVAGTAVFFVVVDRAHPELGF